MIYKIIPRVRIGWRDVWVGAAVTALLFAIGKSLIGLYLGRSTFASGFGAAGSLVVLLVWMYYSAQIFLLGAEFTWVYAHTHGSRSNVDAEEAAARGRGAGAPRPGGRAGAVPHRARSGDAIPASPGSSLRPTTCAVPTSSSSSPTTSASPTSAATAAASRSRRCSTGWPDEGIRFTPGLRQFAGVLADALRAHDRPLPVPAARRRRGADQQQEPRQHDARPAARASDLAVAAEGGGLPHRARRQVAPRLPARVRAAALGLRRVLRADVGRRRLLQPLRLRAARTTCSRARPSTARRATSPT